MVTSPTFLVIPYGINRTNVGSIRQLTRNWSMFDRKNIALEVLSNREFLSNQMFDRKNIALCLTEPLCQTEISTDVLSNQRFDRTSQKCQKYKYFTQNT